MIRRRVDRSVDKEVVARKPMWLDHNRGELDAESEEVCAFCLADWPCDPQEHEAAIWWSGAADELAESES